MEKRVGTIRVVARNGGLKFDDEDTWYNPTESVQQQVTPELRGKTVELDLVGPNIFTGLREVPNIDVTLTDRDLFISRQVAVKTAAEFAKAMPGIIDSVPKLLAAADEIEHWIHKGTQ
jgi:hypothetical protein